MSIFHELVIQQSAAELLPCSRQGSAVCCKPRNFFKNIAHCSTPRPLQPSSFAETWSCFTRTPYLDSDGEPRFTGKLARESNLELCMKPPAGVLCYNYTNPKANYTNQSATANHPAAQPPLQEAPTMSSPEFREPARGSLVLRGCGP